MSRQSAPRTAEANARTAAKRDLFVWLPTVAEMQSGPPAGQEEVLKKARVMSKGGRLNQAAWLRFLLFCVHVATTQGQHGVNLYASNETTADAFGTNTAQANKWLNLAEKLGILEREVSPSPFGTVVRRIRVPQDEPSPSTGPMIVPPAWTELAARPVGTPGYDEPPW